MQRHQVGACAVAVVLAALSFVSFNSQFEIVTPNRDGPSNADAGFHDVEAMNDYDQVLALLESGASLEETNTLGWTPLHVGAFVGNDETVGLLLAHGADPTARTLRGQSPADLANARGNYRVAQVLKAD